MQDKLILFVDSNFYSKLELWEHLGDQFTIHALTNGMEAYKWLLEGNKPDIIISEFYLPGYSGINLLSNIRENVYLKDIPFIFICDHNFEGNIVTAREMGANDIYLRPLNYSRLVVRINMLVRINEQKVKTTQTNTKSVMSLKRIAESALAFFIVVLLSPVFLVIAAIIKLDSRGPVFQVSSRIGKGFKRIKDYKFRSSKWYKKQEITFGTFGEQLRWDSKCPECSKGKDHCSPLLYHDGIIICENHYRKVRGSFAFNQNNSVAEMTSFGRILRRTKIDALPNLINVMKGDMTLIGEEALLPEIAEKYTNDKDSKKLLAEVGLFRPMFISPDELIGDLNDN